MGVGMCLHAQLVQTNNTWCKSAMRYHPYLPYIWLLFPTPVNSNNHIPVIYPGVAKIYLVFFWKCLL